MLGRFVILSGLLLGTGLATAQVLQHTKPAPTTNRALQHDPASKPGVPPGVCQLFFTKAEFDAFNQSEGKFMKGIEDFEPPVSNVGPGVLAVLVDPLQGNVPNVDAAGIGFPNGLLNKNLLIQSNIFEFNAPTISPGSGLVALGPGFIAPGIPNSVKVGASLLAESTDLIFTDDSNKTGVGFTVEEPVGPGFVHISIFDKLNVEIFRGQFDTPPGEKLFLGFWCDQAIGRINIGGPGGELVDNIQMWEDTPPQMPSCPWDCGLPQDKNVGIVDFLALLAQWGGPGTCDFDGGGVGITDFLKLLGSWGPCPAPINDECAGKIIIDRFDSGGTLEEHFDMFGATPSPDPSLCILVDPNPFKDIWYCLRNNTNEKKIVTLSGSVDLLAEVRAGCDCANPGPLVTCGRLVSAVPTSFTMQAGDEVCIRLLNDLGLPNDQIKGNLIITNQPVPPDDLNFFLDPILFFEALDLAGKTEKFLWNFKPDFAPPNQLIGVTSPLDINTHFVNAPGVWSDGVVNLWPPEVDNVQFAANLNPQGPFIPGQFLLYVKGGPDVLLDNNAVLARIDPAGLDSSLTIFSGPPAPIDDNHTAMQLEVVSLGQPGQVAVIHVTVYDKADVEMGKFVLTLEAGQKQFLAFMTKDPAVTIGRVDIWDVNGSEEGISAIATYNQQVPPDVVKFAETPADFFGNLPLTKFTKFTWNFKPDNLPQGVPPILIGDPLDILTHPVVAPGIWDGPAGTLWPPEVDNVQFSSNINPQGPYGPADGMLYLKGPSSDFPLDNNGLVAESFVGGPDTSLTIFSGPPAGDNHTAFELELVSATLGAVAVMHISVYDKLGNEIGKHVITMLPTEKRYLGILSPVTIGRIDIWDTNGGKEGISSITAWQDELPPPGCPGPGDCCDPAGNGSPGCNNLDCCERVCAANPFCCSIEWDDICAGEAAGFPQCQCPPPVITHDLEPCVPPQCPSGDQPLWCLYQVTLVFSDPAICEARGIFPGSLICVTPCPFPGDMLDCDPEAVGFVNFRTIDNDCLFQVLPLNGCEPCPPGAFQFRRIN